MHPLESYIQELRAIRSSGAAVKETSFYPPLSNLLNEIGKKQKPRIRCIIHLQDTGAGLPDGGLFIEEQTRSSITDLTAGAIPARGAIEAKSTSADAWKIAESKQVKDYWARYRQVLVTNYRDFVLVGAGDEGNRTILETYRLAPDEHEFWRRAERPKQFAKQQGESLEEFLKRVMLYQAPLATAKDLAWFLASYAREAKFRIETGELPALTNIRTALEEALGLKFEGARGDHFFRSALIQTLFYGIFSAWVLWSKAHLPTDTKNRFEWGMSAHYLQVPILRKLFHEIAEPGQLETMNLPEVLDWAGAALNRVDRASSSLRSRKATPSNTSMSHSSKPSIPSSAKTWASGTHHIEVVKYMVARVDAELREHSGSRGWAGRSQRLYPRPMLRHRRISRRGAAQNRRNAARAKVATRSMGHDLKRAALEPRLRLRDPPGAFRRRSPPDWVCCSKSLGAPFSDVKHERARCVSDERAHRLGTNEAARSSSSSPKWRRSAKLPSEVKQRYTHPGHPRQPAIQQLRGHRHMDEERELTEAYRTTKAAPAPQGQGLNDLYVRFFRMADRRIVEKTGKGIVSLYLELLWLDGCPSPECASGTWKYSTTSGSTA